MRRAVILACLALLLFKSAALAQEDGYAGLASGRYDDIADGTTRLAASGDRRAEAVLQALKERHLFASSRGGALIIRNGDAFVDARTGASLTTTSEELRPVRVNNRVREALAAALAVLDLRSEDHSIRLKAAEAIYDAHPATVLPAVDRALNHEADAAIRTRLVQARAAIIVTEPTVPRNAEVLDAIKILASRGGLPARAMLVPLQRGGAAEVQHAATEAISVIDLRLRLWGLLQELFYGISLSSVLLLAAMGLAITFGVMGVINMSHGELVMIGAYVTYLAQQATGSPGLGLVLAIPLAFIVTGGLGVLIERSLIRFLYGRPLETLLATWGLSLVLQQAIRSLFGPTNIAVATPDWMSGSIVVGGLLITLNRLVIIVFAGLVMLALTFLLKGTSLGLQIRAVTQNRRMASLMGIRTPRVDALTFGLGSGVAGLAGVAISQIDNVSPNLGQGYIIDSFMVVVFGGVGNLGGTLAGAATLGIANKVLEPAVGAVLAKIIVLLLLIAFIQRKPRGMFPLRGRGIES